MINCVLCSFDVVRDGDVLSHFELFKNGARNEIRTEHEVIFSGVGADRKYAETLETNRQIAAMIGARVVENKPFI